MFNSLKIKIRFLFFIFLFAVSKFDMQAEFQVSFVFYLKEKIN